MPESGFPPHTIAEVFPMLEGPSYTELSTSVGKNGQREDIVLAPDEAKGGIIAVLDGRNRQRAALDKGKTPRFRMFGSKEQDGESMADFVADENLHRRHLSLSQAAVAAAKMMPFFKAEAHARQSAAGGTNGDAPQESVVDTTGEFAQVPPKQKKKKGIAEGSSHKQAGRKFGVSGSSVKRAEKLLKEDPKAAEDVAKGTRSLNAAATGAPSKGSKAEADYAAALERIAEVCGKQQAKGIKEGAILRNRSDVIKYAAQPDKKMLAMRALIDQGWAFQKALNYKAEEINPTHRVADLADRAMANGGHYYQEVLIPNRGIKMLLNMEVKPLKKGK